MAIRNIFCVGRNYADHATELGDTVPGEPMIFSKPTNALVHADDRTVRYPENQGAVHHELEVVLYVGKDVLSDDFAVDDVVSKMALGVDMTLRDVQEELKQEGKPWLLAKGFKNAAVVTEFWDFPGEAACREAYFKLTRDGEVVQTGNINDMIFSFHDIMTYIQAHFGLREGDIIYTGTPEGVGPVSDGETYELWWGDTLQGQFGVSMA
ncbi:fumarylacetoacetate hydrolase family protein [Barrientosiimonas marina]|uniref:Fumarylacetoacetate hydrolase family protein n=1 Tax=Lentibacillus kimchii TaxID=1542911 RepID=A0ABW2UVC0_9BACI